MSKAVVFITLLLSCLAGPVSTAVAADRDGDRMPNRWERRHGLAPSLPSARIDRDKDGLRNRREFRLHTHPRRRDTDRDGLKDGREVKRLKTKPRRRDTDGDGLKDGREVKRLKTKPRRRDTDGDGLGDGLEAKRLRTNPRRADSDGDGVSDAVEVWSGSDPLDRRSRPRAGSPPAPGRPPSTSLSGFPRPGNTGVPAGWSPRALYTSTVRVSTPGAVLQDVQIDNADLIIEAPHVTVRRVLIRGGVVDTMAGARCQDGLVVEDSTIEPPPGQNADPRDHWALGQGGFTARRLEMRRRSDGLRVGGKTYGCGPVNVEDSFISVAPPNPCGDWHGDGIQGYGGGSLNVRNVTIDMSQEGGCGGTAPFFYPHSQGNTSATVNGLLVRGGGYPFRLGMPGSVRGLRIVDRSWSYGPIDVKCSAISSWEAAIVTITADFQPARTVRPQPCNTETGG